MPSPPPLPGPPPGAPPPSAGSRRQQMPLIPRDAELDAMERDKARAMLDQRCLLLDTSACTWPDVSQLFSEPGWEDAALQAERRALTEVKSRLDNMPNRWGWLSQAAHATCNRGRAEGLPACMCVSGVQQKRGMQQQEHEEGGRWFVGYCSRTKNRLGLAMVLTSDRCSAGTGGCCEPIELPMQQGRVEGLPASMRVARA